MTKDEYLMRWFGKMREATVEIGKMIAMPREAAHHWRLANEALFEANMARDGFVSADKIKPVETSGDLTIDHHLEFGKWLYEHHKITDDIGEDVATGV